MFSTHYPPLFIAYAVALVGWVVADRLAPGVWPASSEMTFARPWREFGFALLAVIMVLLVGQLYVHGIRVPETGALRPLAASINQVLIYAPLLLLPLIRGQSWDSAWLSERKLGLRTVIGLVLAILGVTAYSLLRQGASYPWQMLGRIVRYGNLDILVQVFLEDVVIAILFIRFAATVGSKWAIVTVGALFAAAHIPAMLANGVPLRDLGTVLLDAALGITIISIVRKSRDVAWIFLIHFCMDMTQFSRITFGR